MEATFRRHPLQSPGRPDVLFALVAGLFAALLVSPALVLVVALWVTSDGSVLAVALLLTITVLTVAAAVGVREVRGLAERLGATAVAWLLPLVAAACSVGYLAVGVSDVPPPATGGLGMAGFFSGMAAAVLGVGLVVMGRSRYAAALVDEERVTAEWTAGWPARSRRVVVGVSMLLFVLVPVGWIGEWLLGDGRLFFVGQAALLAGVVLMNVGQEFTYRLTPDGLERSRPVVRRFHPWAEFVAVRTTAESVVLVRRGWWRPAMRCARADIDDEAAVIAALSERVGTP